MDQQRVCAAGNGAMSYFYFSGNDKRTGNPYVYVETIGGGSGARYNKDGMDAVQVHMTNTSNLPVEALEMEYPLMVEKYALSENSGGAGKYRGGMGIVRAIRILEESEGSMLISAATERSVSRPWGLNGGQEGGNASIKVYRNGEVISDNPKPRNIQLQKDDIVEMITAGAGGYGPVSERDQDLIRKEYKEGIIDDKWIEEAGIKITL
jgi:N-methylhydantoinase B